MLSKLKQVRDSIAKNVPVNVPKKESQVEKETILFKAIEKGQLDEVTAMLERKGVNINAQGEGGNSLLHAAVKKDSIEIVSLLITKGANVNARNELGNTPLHQAALWGSTAITEVLHNQGADVHAQNKIGKTPLHLAAQGGQIGMIKLLVEKWGVQIENPQISHQWTALHSAAHNGKAKAVACLIELGAKVTSVNEQLRTPLHHAAFIGDIETIKVILNAKANVNAEDDKRHTPLHFAANKGNLLAVKLLLESEADINAKSGENNESPMHLALCNGQRKVVLYLIEYGAIVTERDRIVAKQHDRESWLPPSEFEYDVHRKGEGKSLEYNDDREEREQPQSLKVPSPQVSSSNNSRTVLHPLADVLFQDAKNEIRKKNFSFAIEKLIGAINKQRGETAYRDPSLIPLLHQRAFCYLATGKRVDAHTDFGYLIECLEIKVKQEGQANKKELASLYLQLAYFHLCHSAFVNDKEDIQKAHDYQKRAEGVVPKEGMEPEELATFYATSAIVYYNSLKMEKAKEQMEQALSKFRTLRISNANTLRYEEVLRKARDYQEQEEKYRYSSKKVKIKREGGFNFFYPIFREPTEFIFEIFKIEGQIKKEGVKVRSYTRHVYGATPAGIVPVTQRGQQYTPYTKKTTF